MAKVVKLKDRSGSAVLPLTRSQLVQVSQITGFTLTNGWDKASVQTVLEALYTYIATVNDSNAGALSDITTIKNALEGVLDSQKAVVNYVDAQDTAYLALAYAEAASKADAAQANAYAQSAADAAAAQANAYAKAESEAAAAQANSYAKAEAEATAAQANAYAYTRAEVDTAYTNANNYTDAKIAELDNTIAPTEGKVFTSITQTDGLVTSYTEANLTATDIVRTSTYDNDTHRGIQATTVEGALAELEAAIQVGGTGSVVTLNRYGADTSYTARYEIAQGGSSLGYIDIPKDMVATDGSLVYGSMSGDTFTENASGDPYIMMTIANGDPFYIPVKGLVEYNEFSESNEVGFTDTNHNVTAYINEIDTDKIKHNNKSVTTYLTDMQTELDGIETTLVSYEGRIAANEGQLNSYNTRIEALETNASALSYTIDASGTSYITVTPSTSNGATTFTVTTSDIASDTNLQALQTSYNNMNTELTNAGVFYEEISGVTGDATSDITLFT